jgi:beta-phosphoglucomutase-like phosphatase (HAD superfamily)
MTVRDGLVIFDSDGVLIDSESIAARTISEKLVDFDITMSQREALDSFVGKSEKDVRADLFTRGLEDYDKFAVSWRKHL